MRRVHSTAKSALASEHLHEQQVAVDVLGKLKTAASNKFLTAKLRAFKDVPPALQLDLYLATKDSTDESVNSAVTDLNAEIAKRPLDKFSLARVGGNVEPGRNIFVSSAAAQCSRCHKLGGKQNSVGPDLLKIATKRDLDYLLRAIVKPSADMDAKYRPQQFILLSGKTVSGTVLSETDDAFIVAESADKTTRVAKEDVDERVEQKVSIMPDMTKTLSLRQIRDLVAFLSSLK